MRHVHVFVVLGLALVGCATATDAGVEPGTGGHGGATASGGAGGGTSFGGTGSTGYATGGTGETSSGGQAGAVSVGGGSTGGSTTGGNGNTGGTTGGTGGSTGGTGGTTGGTGGVTGGTGGTTGGTGGTCTTSGGGAPAATGVTLKYQDEHPGSGYDFGSQVFLYNDTTSDLALDGIKLYYYFTIDGVKKPISNINWGNVQAESGGPQTQIGGNITIQAQANSLSACKADSVVVFGFSGVTLKPGWRAQFSWTVQNNETIKFDQSNDYSYAAYSSATLWDHIVVKQGSTVLWGIAP